MNRAEWFQFSKEDRNLKLKALLNELLMSNTSTSIVELKNRKKIKQQIYAILDYENIESKNYE